MCFGQYGGMKQHCCESSGHLKQSEEADEGMARLDVDGGWIVDVGYARLHWLHQVGAGRF